jgi:apolipoprotein N-acyltransferase
MNYLLGAFSGVLLVLLFPKFDIAILAPFALTPLFIAIAREQSPWKRALIGEACGFIFWIGVCYWIRPVLDAYGGLNAPLAWLALILFAVAKALHTAVFAWLGGYFMPRPWAIPAVAALWAGIERTHGPLGFAWLTLGNAGSEMSLPLRLAPFTGVYGISFVFAMLACGFALLILRRPRRQLLPLLMLPLLFLLPEMPAVATGSRTAAVVQPNLAEDSPPDLERLLNRSAVAAIGGADFIAWPEAPVGFYWDRDPVFRYELSGLARRTATPVLAGVVTHNAAGAPLNSAVLVSAGGEELARYSKTFLVPFGEFVPPLFGWIQKISTEAGDFAPGPGPRPLPLNGRTLGVFICYEAAFPHLVRRFAANEADVLVNLSNDGWFFDTSAREQHLLLARMRAAENRRWLLRVTNNGITASLDPAGRVMKTFPEFREASGQLPFDAVKTTTFYTANGDIFAWTSLGVGVGLALCRAIRGG